MKIDDPQVKNEIDHLKTQLKYIRWEQDSDYLLSDLDRLIFSEEIRLDSQDKYLSPIVIVQELLEQWYYENKSLEPLAMIYKLHHWPIAGFVQTPLIDPVMPSAGIFTKR